MARMMTDDELAMRKSVNLHRQIDRVNHEKLEDPDLYLRYGEKIQDKNASSYLNDAE